MNIFLPSTDENNDKVSELLCLIRPTDSPIFQSTAFKTEVRKSFKPADPLLGRPS